MYSLKASFFVIIIIDNLEKLYEWRTVKVFLLCLISCTSSICIIWCLLMEYVLHVFGRHVCLYPFCFSLFLTHRPSMASKTHPAFFSSQQMLLMHCLHFRCYWCILTLLNVMKAFSLFQMLLIHSYHFQILLLHSTPLLCYWCFCSL